MKNVFYRMEMVISLICLLFSSGLGVASTLAVNTDKEYYDLLILTPRDFSDDLQPLVEHKKQYGITTNIITLDDVYEGVYFPVNGRDNAEKIKYFIKSAKENWSVNFVMLVGGENEMPVRYLNTRITTAPFISDLYYADIYNSSRNFCSWDSNNNGKFGELVFNTTIDEVNLYPDVYVGRLLCHSSSDVKIIVNKIIDYEKNTYNQSWFKNLILCGGDTKPIMLDIASKWIYGHGKGKIAFEGEYIGDKIIENMSGFNPRKLYASTIFSIDKNDAEKLTRKNIDNAINTGAGFILFSGHGGPGIWATHPPLLKHILMPFPLGYTSLDVQNLDNGNKLPVAIFNACSCADFSKRSGVTNPIAWEVVKLENGGAIASFACTTESLSLPSSLCTETLSGYMTNDIFRVYSQGNDTAGAMLAKAITDYLNDYNAMSKYFTLEPNYECMEYWILLGDPSLKIGGYP